MYIPIDRSTSLTLLSERAIGALAQSPSYVGVPSSIFADKYACCYYIRVDSFVLSLIIFES